MNEIDISEFTEIRARRLQRYLAAPERPDETMGYLELAGFLFAIGCSPEIVPPSEWLPVIYHRQEPVFETMEEAGEVMGDIMSLYNRITAEAQAGKVQMPPLCKMLDDPLANLAPGAPLHQWSMGFTFGHDWLEIEWTDFLPDDLEMEFGSIMVALSFFADREFSEELFRHEQREANSLFKDKTFEDLAKKVLPVFLTAMEGYAGMGLSIHGTLVDLELYEKAFADDTEPGRNDPCPCGSGKKYKKCCESAGEPAAAKTPTDRIYQLKIMLKGSKPPIWRRILVPDTTLDSLADYLITAMGWTGGHLHGFHAGNRYYGVPDPDWGDQDMIDESTVLLSEIVSSRQKKFDFDYDFGDGWEHSVLVEKVLGPEPGASYPACLTGRRACPPEDVGGLYGYYEFLDVIGDTGHPEHEETLEWAGGAFDPAEFDLKETNEALADVARDGGWWREFD